jgi:hypothetical protein
MPSPRRLSLSRPPIAARRTSLRLEALEDRAVPSINTYAVSAGAGGGPRVQLHFTDLRIIVDRQGADFFAYDPAFRGGVTAAFGDVNDDGFGDVITGAGPGGGPHVRVFDGRELFSFDRVVELFGLMAYDPGFRGGVFVASADIDGDGASDIITGAGPGGGPHVKVFNGRGALLASFMAYDPDFRGGVTVAAEDLNGDNGDNGLTQPRFTGGPGDAEIVTGAGPGGGPHVKVFDYRPGQPGGAEPIASLMAYDPDFRGGVFVAAGFVSLTQDAQGRRYADIITGAGPGGGPHVKLFSALPGALPALAYREAQSYFATGAGTTSGVRVGVTQTNSIFLTPAFDGILTAPGPGVAPAEVGGLGRPYTPFEPDFTGGLFLGGGGAI